MTTSRKRFYECVVCGRKETNEQTVINEDWNFGVDFDAVEPDKDGGIRGHCRKCEDEKPGKDK